MISKASQVVEVSSTPTTYAAAAGSMIMGLTATEWQAIGVIGGLILAGLTYFTNLYFKRKHDKRLEAEHNEKMER